MYDPGTGRFASSDYLRARTENPLSQNRFVYGLSSPTNWIDPSGHMVFIPALIVIGAGVGAIGNTINYAVNTKGNLTLGGAAEAFVKGGLVGGIATTAGVLVAVGAAQVGASALAGAAMSGAASGLVGNSANNILCGKALADNWLPATATGAVLGPLAQDISPTVGFRTGYSFTRGLWAPRGGYVGSNTEALYWQEAGFDVASQFVSTFALTPAQASGLAAPRSK